MNQPNLICLSLTPNLRCLGFTFGEYVALIIPPAVEVISSLFFIYLYPGPARWAQVLLVVDGILYFIWALLDMLSRVIPAVSMSLSLFRALDFLVGAASFTPILLYSVYLYRLSFRNFIPTLPLKSQPYLKISLPILLVIAIAINEASSFIGIHLETETISNQPLVVAQFSHNSRLLWFTLSRSSLATYTTIQFLFFLLAFARFSRTYLNQRRMELPRSDVTHYFNGIAWITVAIIVGVVESATGFARVSFAIVFARRILRLVARGTLMFGLLKGLDVAKNFDILTDELRGVSRIGRRIPGGRLFGVDPQRNMFHRISQPYSEQSPGEFSSREQRVTAHYEKGHAPFLQIRFSTLDFPAQAVLADMIQQRRRSHSGLIPGADTGNQEDGEDEMAAARAAVRETPRAKSALVMPSVDHSSTLDWMIPPKRIHSRPESGETISDSLSIVRDLERKFPSLPPRVTGKYRGSILGEKYEEDPFPVVGVSRQSSLRKDGGALDQSEEGGPNVTLSSSGSIKRKPAPPLLESIAYISERRKRPVSTWGGLTQDTVKDLVDSPVTPDSPWKDTTGYSPDTTLAGEPSTPSTPKSRRLIARDVIRRASRALSDASIRSAEWLASARSARSGQTPLTPTDIEMYRRGTLGPGSVHLTSGFGEAPSGEHLRVLPQAIRRSADDARIHSKPSQPRTSVGI